MTFQPMRVSSTRLLVTCLAFALLAAGCGNKGALFLPEDEPRPEGAPVAPGDDSDVATGPDDQGDGDEDDDL